MFNRIKVFFTKIKYPAWVLYIILIVLLLLCFGILKFISTYPEIEFISLIKRPFIEKPVVEEGPVVEEEKPVEEKPVAKEKIVEEPEWLTKKLLALLKEYQKTLPAEKPVIMNSMIEISQIRKDFLSSLIEKNPREFLRFSIPLKIRESFPSQARVNIEEKVTLEGSFSVLIVDIIEPPESKMLYSLRVGDKRFSLYPTEQLLSLPSGTKVKISGVRIDDKIALDNNEKESFQIRASSPGTLGTLTAENSGTLGEQKLAFILVNFQDNTNQPVTRAQVQNELSTKVNPYYKEASYNKLSVPGDAFGWYTLPIDSTCDTSLITTEGLKAADNDINFQNYKHLIFGLPTTSSCGWGGIAGGTETIPNINYPYEPNDGQITVTLAWMTVQNLSSTAHIAAHELGHNLAGVYVGEGNALDCGSDVIGVPTYDGGTCTHMGYGDLFDVMGVATLGHFNAYYKETLGWFDPANIINVTASGTYTIEPLETATAGPKIIKIPRDKDGTGKTIGWLYLEFRQLIGFDASAYNFWLNYSPNPTNGALIHYPYPHVWFSSVNYFSYLLDATPESQSNEVYDRADSALEVGKTFIDSAYGITIRTVSKTASSLSVEINLGQPPVCTRANPTVAITPASQSGAPGETLTYNVSVTNNDSGCNPATFSLTPSVPSGWSASLALNELTINPGSSAPTSWSVTSAASASEDLYNVSVGASNKAAPTYTGSASATYIVFIPNRAPVLDLIGNKTINEGQLLEFTISAIDPDGDSVTYSASNLPTGASFNTSTKTFSWIPNFNQSGTYPNVRFIVSDGVLTDFEDITITVNNVNRPPELAPIGNKTINEGSLLEFTISATDPDGDALTYSATGLPTGSTFNTSTKKFSWTPTFTQAGAYPNVHFEVSDGKLTDSEDITITVINVPLNQVPILDSIGNKTINEGQLLEFTISATDPDGDTLTYSASNLPSGATFNTSTKKFSWTPTYDQAGAYSNIHFEVKDATLTDSEDITITVNDVTPITGETPWKSNEHGTLYTNYTTNLTWGYNFTLKVNGQITKLGGFFNGTKTVYLWDSAKNLLAQANVTSSNNWVYTAITPVNVTAGKTYTVAVYNYGAGSYSGGSYRMNVNLPATYGNITINKSCYTTSGFGFPTDPYCWTSKMFGQVDVEFSTSIGPVNRPPDLASIGNKTTNENQLLEFTISATDPDGDTLTYSATGLPTGATFSSQKFSWTPSFTQTGNYSVTFNVNDGKGGTDSETIIITVNNINRPPDLASIGNKIVNEGQLLEFTISATDPDGDSLTFSASNLPSGASFDPVTKKFSWTPNFNQSGTYSNVHFEVKDATLVDSEDITITVNDVPQPVVAGETPWKSNEHGTLYTNYTTNLTWGYNFTLKVNGQITKLGGFFNGTKTVYLWDSAKNLLAQANVTSSNNWVYTAITPVNVTAGKTYTVAVYNYGVGSYSGGSYRMNVNLPATYGNITINKSCYTTSGFGFPTDPYCWTSKMFGQVDIEFVKF